MTDIIAHLESTICGGWRVSKTGAQMHTHVAVALRIRDPATRLTALLDAHEEASCMYTVFGSQDPYDTKDEEVDAASRLQRLLSDLIRGIPRAFALDIPPGERGNAWKYHFAA